ncbi:very short patch repair endonuclease [Flavobacterium lindanitolerans]|jgi:DNA mismatch endonuclease (patch repair protein)|uniref:Very short patch repair endonuclease n=1 Tax=Flavobacterium lindanitolerans TaxID=428988 RepID=A0A497UBQ4_9FLAO|nr:DNA mismatch endonuclease Vsr [Flavobacterium lindanitolerans]PKW20521.1 T/G mismatch-specific endonuclease [Flavobacterium lindanitolerans]RLJ23964.1 DNA mismatch endonuclease (patch repair protein) [Flavobacterium lindanitolerans]
MTDVHSKEVRSFNMSQIKGKDTKPELLVRKFLFAKGLRYRLYDKKLPGKPDIVLPKYNTVIFIHGCFWHGHENCKYFILPKTKTEWWKQKIENTIQRDNMVIEQLADLEWNIHTVWECELKPEKRELTLNKIYNTITANNN